MSVLELLCNASAGGNGDILSLLMLSHLEHADRVKLLRVSKAIGKFIRLHCPIVMSHIEMMVAAQRSIFALGPQRLKIRELVRCTGHGNHPTTVPGGVGIMASGPVGDTVLDNHGAPVFLEATLVPTPQHSSVAKNFMFVYEVDLATMRFVGSLQVGPETAARGLTYGGTLCERVGPGSQCQAAPFRIPSERDTEGDELADKVCALVPDEKRREFYMLRDRLCVPYTTLLCVVEAWQQQRLRRTHNPVHMRVCLVTPLAQLLASQNRSLVNYLIDVRKDRNDVQYAECLRHNPALAIRGLFSFERTYRTWWKLGEGTLRFPMDALGLRYVGPAPSASVHREEGPRFDASPFLSLAFAKPGPVQLRS